MKQNLGYRIGMQTRRFVHWLSVWEKEMQQQGVPRWVTKMPLYLCIAATVGLLLVGAFFIAFFLALMVFIAFCLFAMSGEVHEKSEEESVLYDKSLNGYHYLGPEGPSIYVDGIRVSSPNDDYEDDD